MARKWVKLNIGDAMKLSELPRIEVLRVLDRIEAAGLIQLESKGALMGYNRVPGTFDVGRLVAELGKRFMDREKMDVERIHSVLAFAHQAGCLSKRILEHFGEESGDCGHCSRCEGHRPGALQKEEYLAIPRNVLAEVSELRKLHPDALGHPRQAARFLAGVRSPGMKSHKLYNEKLFGALEKVPFSKLLSSFE